nr:MAG TPA: hypothetical protein [Bacteriophage sp.]
MYSFRDKPRNQNFFLPLLTYATKFNIIYSHKIF